MRRRFLLSTLYLIGCVAFPIVSLGQNEHLKEAAGSISGRVTVGTQPASGITVFAQRASLMQSHPPYDPPDAFSVTDSEGKYVLSGLRPGSFEVKPFAAGHFSSDDNSTTDYDRVHPARLVNLSEGENVHSVNFSLSRGGIITGRITAEDGRPLIERQVNLVRVGDRESLILFPPQSSRTDDRGVYRLYGLPPGSYTVSVGKLGGRELFAGGVSRTSSLVRTYYPGVTVASQATPIEVRGGEEVSGIDFSVGRAVRTFRVSGRVIDTDSGTPMQDMTVVFRRRSPDGSVAGFSGMVSSDLNGEFNQDGVLPGDYELVTYPPQNGTYYGDPIPLQIGDDDIRDLVVKVQPGLGSISGEVVLEGPGDPEIIDRLHQLSLWATIDRPGVTYNATQSVSIDGEGRFRFSGLPPGTVRIEPYDPEESGFFLVRLEINGVSLPEGFLLSEDEAISGVKVVLNFGTGSIQGEIRTRQGPLPLKVQCSITARALAKGMYSGHGDTDSRGHFRIDQLPAGEYDVLVNPHFLPPPGDPRPGRNLKEVVQRVRVTAGVVTQVILTIDLNATAEEESR